MSEAAREGIRVDGKSGRYFVRGCPSEKQSVILWR